jgi:hypothetical protein
MRKLAAAVLAVGLAAISGARADIPPLPGEQERLFLNLIESAGHACGKVDSYKPATGDDAAAYAKDWLNPFVATCANGKIYVVAIPRRPPRLDAEGKLLPPPAIVVKEVDK